jgi:hypothetical protein
MGTKRIGLARVEALMENLKRDLALGAGTVLHGHYKKVELITANQALTAADSGKIFLVNPAATTEVDLPTTLVSGWHCTIILSESTDGSDEGMNNKVNIDFGSGNDVVGMTVAADGDAGDYAVNDDDFIKCAADASPGDRFDIFTDGDRWYVHGIVNDASTVPFHTAAG